MSTCPRLTRSPHPHGSRRNIAGGSVLPQSSTRTKPNRSTLRRSVRSSLPPTPSSAAISTAHSPSGVAALRRPLKHGSRRKGSRSHRAVSPPRTPDNGRTPPTGFSPTTQAACGRQRSCSSPTSPACAPKRSCTFNAAASATTQSPAMPAPQPARNHCRGWYAPAHCHFAPVGSPLFQLPTPAIRRRIAPE